MKLSQAVDGQTVQIVTVQANDPVGLRVLEMGLTPKTRVVRVGSAPLGDPIQFEVRGYRLSLRAAEAERVEVEPVSIADDHRSPDAESS